MTSDDVVEALRSQMYGDATLCTHQWKILGEVLMRQTYTVEDGVRAWRVAGLQVDTGALQDAVRACRERAGETTDEDVEEVVRILQGSWASLTWIDGGED